MNNFDMKWLGAILGIPLGVFAYTGAGLVDPARTLFAVVFLLLFVAGVFSDDEDEINQRRNRGNNSDE